MRKVKLVIGALYAVTFHDHVISDEEEVVECTAYGKLVKENKLHLSLQYWTTHGDKYSHSKEVTNIIKSTIIKVKKLR